jgi:ABC-2 type transport system ATP-binding protein
MTNASSPAIETVNLTRRFGALVAVNRLGLRVPRGCIYGFLGPNGAGKTTTIRMLLGLIRPNEGEAHLLGESFAGSARRGLLRRVGALVEMPSLYPHLTGYQNLQVTQELVGLPRANIDRVLGIVRLRSDAHRRVKEYSLGMRQRLGVALALLGEPQLLILDEPTNGLDPAGIREMRDLIRGLPTEHGVTVFLSSHLLGEVEQIATHVGIVGRGRMLFQGTLGELQGQLREWAVVEVDQPAKAASVLSRIGMPVEVTDEGRLALNLPARTAAARIASELIGAGLDLYQLRLERPSLEDLFLNLTEHYELASTVEVFA